MVTPLRTILSAGLLAGFLDGIAASAQVYLMRGMNPVNVFQYVASGALGRSAFDGGWLTAGARHRVSFGHRLRGQRYSSLRMRGFPFSQRAASLTASPMGCLYG